MIYLWHIFNILYRRIACLLLKFWHESHQHLLSLPALKVSESPAWKILTLKVLGKLHIGWYSEADSTGQTCKVPTENGEVKESKRWKFLFPSSIFVCRLTQYSAVILSLLVICFIFISHWLACVWFIIGQHQDGGENIGNIMWCIHLYLYCSLSSNYWIYNYWFS